LSTSSSAEIGAGVVVEDRLTAAERGRQKTPVGAGERQKKVKGFVRWRRPDPRV
jgi:hypothetical protein